MSGPAPGPWNMALDEAIFQLYLEQSKPPTLRIYTWSPPCLTVGYSQSVARNIDLGRCQAAGLLVVRRPTGGRAILHGAEATFSLVAPVSSGSIASSYGTVAQAVILALATFGLKAEMAGPRARPLDSPRSGACFDSAFGHEVVLGERKVAGIAQARRLEGMLCQGTLLLDMDASRLFSFLLLPEEEKRLYAHRFQDKVVTLSEALGRPVSWEEAAQSLARGFAQALETDLVPDEPTLEETDLAQRLLQEKYHNPAWNLAR
ncbi:MAG: lipoate--protein ligase family protein [Chloroflexi bacterium]|nr:lipoate--protein ligase family protein [Chloroflexota bacterium]